MVVLSWKLVFVCLILFVSPGGGYVQMRVYLQDQTPIMINIYFPDDVFSQFYQCLCKRETSSCTAEYTNQLIQNGFYFIVTNQSNTESHDQTTSSFYKCKIFHNSTNGRIQCWKQPIACGDPDIYQAFNLKDVQSCDMKCIGITDYSGQSITLNLVNGLTSCESSCPEATTTYTTTASTEQTKTTAREIGISETIPQSTKEISASKTDSQTEGEINTDNKAMIIVGVVLSLIILVLLIVFGICFWRIKRRARKIPNKNSQSSNTPISFHNSNVGYENSITIDDEETHPNIQDPSTEVYSNVPSTGHPTNNKNYTDHTADDLCASFNSPYSLADDDTAANLRSPESRDQSTQSVNGGYNYTNASDDVVGSDSTYAEVASKAPRDKNSPYCNINRKYKATKTDDIIMQNSEPYSLATIDSVNSDVNIDTADSVTIGNEPDASHTYSTLHEKVTKVKNLYDVL